MDDDINLDAVEDVLDDYYTEDDAMLEADEEPWEDSEDYGFEDDDQDDFGIEDDDDGESAERRRGRSSYRRRAARARARRARARALARARSRGVRRYRNRRRRRPTRRKRYMPPRRTRSKANASQVRKGFNRVSDDVAKTKAKIAKVDLESKVKADALKEAFKKQSTRIGGSEYAISATKVIDEITQQFPQIKEDKILKSLVPLVPLAFLKPSKKGSGFESLVKDPRYLGAGIAGAIALFRGLNPPEKEPEPARPVPTSIRTGPAPQLVLKKGQSIPVQAYVLDQNNQPIQGEGIRWAVVDTNVANVDAGLNTVTAFAEEGSTMIVASSVTNPALTSGIIIDVRKVP